MAEISRGMDKWKCLLSLLSVLCFLPSSNCDMTSHHLHKYLNHSVHACRDFHGHVCGMRPINAAPVKSELYYKFLAAQLNSRSRNNAIMNDIAEARKSGNCSFDSDSYKATLESRCGEKFDCFLEEFHYFFKLYNLTKEDQVEDTLAFFAVRARKSSHNIPRLVNATAKMIELMNKSDEEEEGDDGALDAIVQPFEQLHDRLVIMEALKRANRTTDFWMNKVRDLTKQLKDVISHRFMETHWLNDTDVFGFDRLSQLLTILDEMRIMSDFDELDADLSFWRKIERLITTKYFENSKRSTGCIQFDVVHSFITLQLEINSIIDTGENLMIFNRITQGFVYNAFNHVKTHSIILLGPTFYPLMSERSSDTTLLGFAYLIAHEIYHSFVTFDLANRSEEFRSERDCIIAHFNSSCDKWAKGDCKSGNQTFVEDGSDVEAIRAAYDLLTKMYDDEELQEYEYEKLEITREQAFFYAFGVRYCGYINEKQHANHTDVHSLDNVRLNAIVSMLPEFTKAFGCEEGDEEYSHEETSCHLFGPRSGSRVEDAEDEEEESEKSEEDAEDDASSEDTNEESEEESEEESDEEDVETSDEENSEEEDEEDNEDEGQSEEEDAEYESDEEDDNDASDEEERRTKESKEAFLRKGNHMRQSQSVKGRSRAGRVLN